MRVWHWGIALLPLSLAAQIPLEILSTTLVDALSADKDYTHLLRLLQRARLIPTLNKLNGSTLFAPTNEAIKRNKLWNSLLDQDDLKDNIQEKLRQQLFYHMLNYTLPHVPAPPDELSDDPNIQVHKTLHFPQTYVEPPSDEPAPSPPWLPLPGGSLGNEPQRIRVSSREGAAYVGVDAFGKGGVEITKGKVNVRNGVLLGIDGVLTPPTDLATLVSEQPSISYFHGILTPEITNVLSSSTELTVFLPVDKAWENLHPLERLYLESEFATDDLKRILDMHAVHDKKVAWSEVFDPKTTLTTIDGSTLDIIVTPEKTTVSSADLIEPDIYASNGVLHLVSSLLITPGSLKLTPEKYLLALNCTSFVSLLHSVNLTGLVNDTDAKYTILAPKDDILAVFGSDDLPAKGSEELKRLLAYHFLPGHWSQNKLRDGMLLETALEEDGLGGGRQVLGVEVSEVGKGTEGNIKFGGAATIGEHVEINNTLIYFLSRPLVPPSDVLQTALPMLDLSSFLAAVFSTTLADTLRTTPSISLLVPHNTAFKRLGLLVSEHLLAPTSKADLESVIKHHAIAGVEYASELVNGSQRTYPTLEGSDIVVERIEDEPKSNHHHNVSVMITASGGWSGMKTKLHPRDLLTSTGVLHEVTDLMIPRSVDMNIGKLMKAAGGTTMANMVTKAGMDWLLNGTAPPEGSPWAEAGVGGAGWTLLCPTDDAFKKYNLTAILDDLEGLRAIVSQHLIPTPIPSSSIASTKTTWYWSLFKGQSRVEQTMKVLTALDVLNNNRPLSLADSATYSTLLSPSSAYGDIIFRQLKDEPRAEGGYVVGINGARGTDGKGDWATVLAWGRSTTGRGTGGVIQINRLLVPYHPSWGVMYGGPAVVGVLGILMILAFFIVVRMIWRRDATEATYEPVGGFGRDDES